MEPLNNESIGTANFFIIWRFSLLRGTNLLKSMQMVHIGHYERFFTIGGVHYRRFHCIMKGPCVQDCMRMCVTLYCMYSYDAVQYTTICTNTSC